MSKTVAITERILSVSTTAAPPTPVIASEVPPIVHAPVVQVVHEKMKRPGILEGRTYKLKTPLSDSALYLTVNDVVLNKGTPFEVRHPFEIFINSKDMQNYQWVVAVTRLVSAIFRKGGDVTFILDELKSICDPNGGYFSSRGRIPSLVAEIGMTIEEHFKHIGLIPSEIDPEIAQFISQKKEAHAKSGGSFANARQCLKCGATAVVMLENCPCCLECGDSKCG